MKNIKLFFFAIFLFQAINCKVLIITYAFNRPDFIEIQYKTLKKFLKDDYKFVVFSDAKNEAMHNDIAETCIKLNLKCYRVPQEIHTRPYLERTDTSSYQLPAIRNSNVVQYSLDTLGFKHNDIVALFDSDLFLIKEFSIRDYLKGYNIAGCRHMGRVICPQNLLENIEPQNKFSLPVCFWIGLVFLDMRAIRNKKIINFNCGAINGMGVDAGGFIHYFLNSSEAKPKFFEKFHLVDLICDSCRKNPGTPSFCNHLTDELNAIHLTKPIIKLIESMPLYHDSIHCEFFLNFTFLHYRAGSNYTHHSLNYHKEKTCVMNQFFREIL